VSAFSRADQSKISALVRSGVRTREDSRATLWQSFMKVVERLHPPIVLVKNVPNLPTWDDGAVLIEFLESFRALGHSVEAQVIDRGGAAGVAVAARSADDCHRAFERGERAALAGRGAGEGEGEGCCVPRRR
jgi:hypothetical protein